MLDPRPLEVVLAKYLVAPGFENGERGSRFSSPYSLTVLLSVISCVVILAASASNLVAQSRIDDRGMRSHQIPPTPQVTCGAESVFIVHASMKGSTSLSAIVSLLPADSAGENSLSELSHVLRTLGHHTAIVKLNCRGLKQLTSPAIIHLTRDSASLREGHFLLFLGFTENDDVVLLDAPRPPEIFSHRRFHEMFQGNTVLVSATASELSTLIRAIDTVQNPVWTDPWILLICCETAIVGILSVVGLKKMGLWSQRETARFSRS